MKRGLGSIPKWGYVLFAILLIFLGRESTSPERTRRKRISRRLARCWSPG